MCEHNAEAGSMQLNREKRYTYRALDRNVLVVAVETVCMGDWSAYIGAVPGKCHEVEYIEVAASGTKLQKAVAEELFPRLRTLRWRD
jgi:hypothetical protein